MWYQYFILLTSFIINHKVMGLVEQVVDRRTALFRLPLTTPAIPLLWRGQPAIAQSMERNNLDFILSRVNDMQAPFQLNALQYGVRGDLDTLVMPEWLLGKWTVRSRLAASSAPLGRKYLPPDLRNMLITRDNENSDQEVVAKAKDAVAQAPGLEYQVQFIRRSSNDGAVVADRAYNLKSVQDAAAGYSKVAQVTMKGAGRQLSVQYMPFDRNGNRIGPSRAEVYINARLESSPRRDLDIFAFSEATRTIRLGERFASAADAETLNVFRRTTALSGLEEKKERIECRQRVLRFLTPNPNSEEGILWQDAKGRATAILDYDLELTRQLS